MNLASLPSPVTSDGSYGGDQLNTHLLKEFCNRATGNFHTLASEVQMQKLRLSELSNINAKLIQFMNWLAVTNPQILDEFQNTANAFEKLSPRNDGGETTAFATP